MGGGRTSQEKGGRHQKVHCQVDCQPPRVSRAHSRAQSSPQKCLPGYVHWCHRQLGSCLCHFRCSFPWVASRHGGSCDIEHPMRSRRSWLSLWGSSSSWLSVAAAWERSETMEPGHPWPPAFPLSIADRLWAEQQRAGRMASIKKKREPRARRCCLLLQAHGLLWLEWHLAWAVGTPSPGI